MMRCLRIAAVLIIAAVVMTGAPARAETIRLAHGASTQHPFHEYALMFKRTLEARSGDEARVIVFGNAQLGGDKQVLESVMLGTLDAAVVSSVLISLTTDVKSFDALQLPFLIPSYEAEAALLQSGVADEMLASLDQAGIKGLGFAEGGLRHFLNSGDAVRHMADFEGLKTRIVPVPLHKAIWESLGTRPVGIAYSEVYTAMQTHVIDAVEFNVSSVESENLYENARNLTLTGHYFWPGVLIFNKNRFERLPGKMQEALIETGTELTGRHIEYTARHEREARERLRERGVTIVEFAEREELRRRTEPIIDQWRGRDPLIARFIDAARAHSGAGQ